MGSSQGLHTPAASNFSMIFYINYILIFGVLGLISLRIYYGSNQTQIPVDTYTLVSSGYGKAIVGGHTYFRLLLLPAHSFIVFLANLDQRNAKSSIGKGSERIECVSLYWKGLLTLFTSMWCQSLAIRIQDGIREGM